MTRYAIAGKPVRDADKPRRLPVIREDIEAGLRGEDTCCPIALAGQRQNGILSARVTDGFTLLEYAKEWVRYLTPKTARTALALFDQTGVMLSQTFELQPVRGVRRLENRGTAVRRHQENVEAGTARVNRGYRKRVSLTAQIPGARRWNPSVRIEKLADAPRTIGPKPRLPFAEDFSTGQTEA